jgi:hypothetical protein
MDNKIIVKEIKSNKDWRLECEELRKRVLWLEEVIKRRDLLIAAYESDE